MRTTAILLAGVVSAGCPNRQIGGPSAPPMVAEGRLMPMYSAEGSGRDSVLSHDRFVIPVTIHGQTIRVMADHGSNGSFLTDAAIDRLGLSHWYSAAARVDTLFRRSGVDPKPDTSASVVITRGDTTFAYFGDFEPMTVLDSLRIGTSLQDKVMLPFESPADALAPYDGLIGRDILSAFDLLFDVPAGRLQLYSRSPSATSLPAWLPKGMATDDCVVAKNIRHMGMDTTRLTDEDRKELAGNPAKRMFDQEELKLPLLVNGLPIDALFDSGSGATVMNWSQARALGIRRDNPAVRPYMAGGVPVFTFHSDRTPAVAGYVDSTFGVSGVSVQIGRRRLPSGTVLISDPSFVDYPDFMTKPMMLVGLRHLRKHRLFFSYSTGMICIGPG